MSSIGIRVRKIRDAEKLGRASFCDKTGINKSTLTQMETTPIDSKTSLTEAVCKAFPKYAYWLMTGLTDEKAGHISPEIEISRNNLDEEKTD